MKILLTHDGSELADVAIPNVRALALAAGADAEITALCITTSHASEGSTAVRDAEESLERIRQVLAPHHVTPQIRAGNPGPVIVETAGQLGCDIIVMSTSGLSGHKHFLGSVADYVVRNSRQIPVMLCRPAIAGTQHFRKILLPLDGSTMNVNAIAEAQRLASLTGAGVVLLRLTDEALHLRSMHTPAGYELSTDLIDDDTVQHIINAELESARRELADDAARMRVAGLHDLIATVTPGTPGETIVRTAETERCDVIVMSSRGRGAGRQLLGSVADHVLQHVGEAAVIVVPPAPEATPA